MMISIITICYNSEAHIETCIKSVVNQTYTNLEYIVIDGNSTDGTIAVIEKYDQQISKWISEKDSGISEAMNKGLEMAKGEYILFLHSDDYILSDGSIENAVKQMNQDSDIHAFSVTFGNEEQSTLIPSTPFSLRIWFKTNIMHQGAFCKKVLFESLGGFDESFSITMDYDFFFRASLSNCKLLCHKMPISFMRDTGISSRKDWDSLRKRFSEERKVHSKNASNPALKLIHPIYWLLYPKYRYVRLKLGI